MKDIVAVDRAGVISKSREGLSGVKKELAALSPRDVSGTLADALSGADVFIGVSGPNLVTEDEIRTMNAGAIVFALSNPVPEILPEAALRAGAAVVATGRSDFPNQVNNALVFPGVFRGAFDGNVRKITDEMKLRAAYALAALIEAPSKDAIIPDVLDPRVVPAVAETVVRS